jgi:uncharacterized protein (DUF58 family)
MRPLFRILYLLYRLFSGLVYRARRRFSRAGLVVMLSLLITVLMGPDTENTVTYQGFTLLFFLLLVSFSFTFWFRGRFGAQRSLPRFGTVGCPLTYTVRVNNLTGRVQSGLVLLETFAERAPGFREWFAFQVAESRRARSFRVSQHRRTHPFKFATVTEVPLPAIPPKQAVDVRMEMVPLRRGLLRLSGVAVARSDPLGLCRSFSKVPVAGSILILPQRYPLPPLALPGTLKYQEGGVALSSHVGESEEFVALRDYRHGDPPRHIHWRSWAKAGKPVVKEFEDEFFVRHALVMDTFTSNPRDEAFEEAVSVAASFACTIQTQESLLDLLFVGPESYCFTTGRGLGQADQMLEVLAAVTPCRDRPFRALEHLVLTHVSAVSGCICVLLSWDQERQDFVKKLRLLGLPVLVLVVVHAGQGKALEPGPMNSAPERFHVLEVGNVESVLAKLK